MHDRRQKHDLSGRGKGRDASSEAPTWVEGKLPPTPLKNVARSPASEAIKIWTEPDFCLLARSEIGKKLLADLRPIHEKMLAMESSKSDYDRKVGELTYALVQATRKIPPSHHIGRLVGYKTQAIQAAGKIRRQIENEKKTFNLAQHDTEYSKRGREKGELIKSAVRGYAAQANQVGKIARRCEKLITNFEAAQSKEVAANVQLATDTKKDRHRFFNRLIEAERSTNALHISTDAFDAAPNIAHSRRLVTSDGKRFFAYRMIAIANAGLDSAAGITKPEVNSDKLQIATMTYLACLKLLEPELNRQATQSIREMGNSLAIYVIRWLAQKMPIDPTQA